MRPIRKLKIQDKADMNEDLIKDFIDENEELTLLMAVNCIVTLAEDSELSSSFFEKADRFITYFSERQQKALCSGNHARAKSNHPQKRQFVL